MSKGVPSVLAATHQVINRGTVPAQWESSTSDCQSSRTVGILGMNIIKNCKNQLLSCQGENYLKKLLRKGEHAKLASVFWDCKKEDEFGGPTGKVGYVKLAGKSPIVIPLFS